MKILIKHGFYEAEHLKKFEKNINRLISNATKSEETIDGMIYTIDKMNVKFNKNGNVLI